MSAEHPRVTFSIPGNIVPVRILGERDDRPCDLPRLRLDGGLVAKFLQWTIEQKIDSAISAGHSSRGDYLGFYYAEDAEKIRGWFKAQGVKEDVRRTWGRGK